MMKNVFDPSVTDELIERIDKLSPTSNNLWGKMNVAQMLAHCNVVYEMVFDNIHPKPGVLKKLFLKLLVKPVVVGDKPYSKNLRTAPQFLKTHESDFHREKKRLIEHIKKTQELGEDYFVDMEYVSFGKLTKKQWNTLFYKHLNHHFQQFGV